MKINRLLIGALAFAGLAGPVYGRAFRYTPKQIAKLGAAAEQNYASGNTALANQEARLHNEAINNHIRQRPNGFVATQYANGNQFIGKQ
jgi:hypothetical protein